MGMGKRVPEHALTAEERKLLSSCLEEARRSIHADYEKAPSQFKAFFLYVEREIFSPDFTIGAARDAANFKSNSYTTRFYKITGKRPKEYVEHHRIMTAQKIIKHTDVYHWQVGSMVGFSYPSVFSRSYKKVVGYPPNRESEKSTGCANIARSEVRQPAELQPLTNSNTLDPRVSPNTAEISTTHSRLDLVKFWEDIRDMSRSEIKIYLLAHIEVVDVDHYYYLLEKAKHETRLDRGRGRDLCLAALDTLRLAEFKQGKEFPDEKATSYAILANICKFEFDFDGARRWFRLADRFLPRDSSEKPLLFAQVNLMRASLMWWQRDTEAALRLLDDIFENIRKHGSHMLLARALLLKADIYEACGHPERALPLLTEALELTKFIDDSYVIFSAHFNMTHVYTRLSMASAAMAQFEEVTKLSGAVRSQISPFYLSHLQGSVARVNQDFRSAELLFLEAREGFLTQGLDIYAALVALELGIVYLELEKPEEAFLAAISAIPIVSRYSVHQQAIAALAVLQQAEGLQRIDAQILRRALKCLDLVRKQPTANFLC